MTVEVWTSTGLTTFYVLFFIQLQTRRVSLAGITPCPNEAWLKQVARNATAEGGPTTNARFLLHDRDARFSGTFDAVLREAGIKAIKLPPNHQDLERWNRSVKVECLSKMILFGDASLQQVLTNYAHHYHSERNHQGQANVRLFPEPADRIGQRSGEVRTRERLGGLLKSYYCEAA